MRIDYGNGKLLTQQGEVEGLKCLAITKQETARPINSTPKDWKKQVEQDEVDVLIVFKSIESARVLQDELNELIAKWSRENSPIV